MHAVFRKTWANGFTCDLLHLLPFKQQKFGFRSEKEIKKERMLVMLEEQ